MKRTIGDFTVYKKFFCCFHFANHNKRIQKFVFIVSAHIWKLPTFLSRLNEISGGCEKILPVSGSFWSNLKLLRMILLTAWLWGWKVRVNGIPLLEIIFLYSEDICPFKSSFWSDIWQIGPDIIYWPWRRELKMCWWHVWSSCPIIMWNWPDIFKIWSDTVRWPTVISSTGILSFLSFCDVCSDDCRWNCSRCKLVFSLLTLARYRDLSDLLRSPIVSHVPPQMSFIA